MFDGVGLVDVYVAIFDCAWLVFMLRFVFVFELVNGVGGAYVLRWCLF